MTRVLTTLALAAAVAVTASAQVKRTLMDPSTLNEKAPATFKAKLDTSAGVIEVQVTRAWAPLGADRFYNLVKNGFYDGTRFYRVVPNFMVQWGFNGDPAVHRVWDNANLKDDPAGLHSNVRGTIAFANRGPNTRSTQLFISTKNNSYLDRQFMPFGEVTSDMSVVDKINAQYGEQPDQNQIRMNGNKYLAKFPKLDYIKKATIEP